MVFAVVAEFNPFHKGHKHLIDTVKHDGDFVVAVMSGNFVQRGDFSVLSKWNRAETALQNGVDLVVELPTPFAIKSAEGFAHSGVSIINSLGCVDKIVFGAENDNISELENVAALLLDNKTNTLIDNELKKGVSYPVARKKAVDSTVLDTPNNILAVEYIKAVKRLNSNIECVPVKRIGNGHDSMNCGDFPSATFIRSQMKNDSNISLMENCQLAVLSKLRTMSKEDFLEIEDVGEGLENRIFESVKTAKNLTELYDNIKCKRYTHSRIRRIILRSYLGIKKNDWDDIPYIKVLGFNESGKKLMKQIKACCKLPIVQKYSDRNILDKYGKSLIDKECICTDLHALGFNPVVNCGLEMTKSIVKSE